MVSQPEDPLCSPPLRLLVSHLRFLHANPLEVPLLTLASNPADCLHCSLLVLLLLSLLRVLPRNLPPDQVGSPALLLQVSLVPNHLYSPALNPLTLRLSSPPVLHRLNPRPLLPSSPVVGPACNLLVRLAASPVLSLLMFLALNPLGLLRCNLRQLRRFSPLKSPALNRLDYRHFNHLVIPALNPALCLVRIQAASRTVLRRHSPLDDLRTSPVAHPVVSRVVLLVSSRCRDLLVYPRSSLLGRLRCNQVTVPLCNPLGPQRYSPLVFPQLSRRMSHQCSRPQCPLIIPVGSLLVILVLSPVGVLQCSPRSLLLVNPL